MSKFAAKLLARPSGSCQCWDCLRAEGLTPPLGLRAKHRSLYPDKEMRGKGIDRAVDSPELEQAA